MAVLGIVGSPRKNKRTDKLVEAALEGVRSAGMAAHKIYLVDYDIRPYCGRGGSEEAFTLGPRDLSRLCGEAEAIVLGAPVYWGDINGLTKDFMDTVQTPDSNGKPALGIAIAGGSGKGLLSGVQSIYHFFYHRQMRGIDPTPVSRFNMQEALEGLKVSGQRLAEAARNRQPFPGESREERWPEVLAHYATLDYLDDGPLEEFLMLAEQLLELSANGRGKADENEVDRARIEFDEALEALEAGHLEDAARHAVRCYQILFF
ncbi:MAG: flavodoxin family protein [Chloroflexi bacterium]|nr:flavodoxin family protein [Chloroflexota bacterium]